jgi:hypothetical protein
MALSAIHRKAVTTGGRGVGRVVNFGGHLSSIRAPGFSLDEEEGKRCLKRQERWRFVPLLTQHCFATGRGAEEISMLSTLTARRHRAQAEHEDQTGHITYDSRQVMAHKELVSCLQDPECLYGVLRDVVWSPFRSKGRIT